MAGWARSLGKHNREYTVELQEAAAEYVQSHGKLLEHFKLMYLWETQGTTKEHYETLLILQHKLFVLNTLLVLPVTEYQVISGNILAVYVT